MSSLGLETFDLDEADRRALVVADSAEIHLRVGDKDVELPPEAARAVRRLLHDLSTGGPVHLIPGDAELTTQQAADLLGLSRTYVVRLIDQGTLPAHFAGSHRRLQTAHVLDYRTRRAQRFAGLAEITAVDEDLGLPYE